MLLFMLEVFSASFEQYIIQSLMIMDQMIELFITLIH